MNRAAGHLLRKGRFSAPGRAYHITTTTHNRIPIFRDWHLGRFVVRSLYHLRQRGQAETLAFVVMPDHVHWLFILGDDSSLGALVNTWKGFSGKHIRKSLGGTGPVWQRGFHDHAIRRDEDLRATARYIVANPLRAGLVDDIGQYPL